MARLRIGSRGSQLALWQANHVADLLREKGHEVTIEIIKTTGDKITDVALAKVGTKGMFTKEIEEALADKRVDLAVHSLKDLPTELPKGFEIAAITERQDPRDAFILASAGLKRLGKTELIKQIIPAEIMCPAAGQGALGIEIREGDIESRELLSFLDDPNARAATTCERALLNSLGGGCQVPIGAFAEVRPSQGSHRRGGLGSQHDRAGQEFTRADQTRGKEGASAPGVIIHLDSIVADPDGTKLLRDSRDGTDPEKLGNEAGACLLARGGDAILEAVYGRGLTVPPQP